MGIRYEPAQDLQIIVNELVVMMFPHVKLDSVVCIRSHGSSSRGTIARCHALGKAMQLALGRKGFYVIEIISKRFDKMSEEEKTKTLIHELMHIPKSFGGGFIHHNIVHERNVDRMYERYTNLKKTSLIREVNNSNNSKDADFGQRWEKSEMPEREEKGFVIVNRKKRFWF